jgi:2-polyprenyl-3-methyl-5-hydroxy-6-metoxy-1,4-benzoquinol methylase
MSTILCPICCSEKKKHCFDVPGAVVSRCLSCSHCFSHDVRATPNEVYNEDYFKEDHENWFKYPNYPLFQKIERMIAKKFSKKDISILDVGCGNGDFLKYLHQKGYVNLSGVDFSKNELPFIQFFQGDIFDVKSQLTRPFDVIVTLATIEHLQDVRQFVSLLSSLVSPGGMVCIMTLDENALIYRLARMAKWAGISHGVNRLYDRHHLNHFSRTSLRNLITMSGNFEILEHDSVNFPVAAIDLPKSMLNGLIKPMVKFVFFMTELFKRGRFLQVVSFSSDHHKA